MKLNHKLITLVMVGAASVALTGCDKDVRPANAPTTPSGGQAPQTGTPPAVAAPLNATCLNPSAASTIQDILVEGVEARARQENQGRADSDRIDLSKVRAIAGQIKVDLQDVITAKNDPNSTKKFCEATMVLAMNGADVDKADALRTRSGQNSIKSIAEDAGFRVDLNRYSKRAAYNVQPTDDGQKIFVTLEEGGQYVALVSQAVLWAAANKSAGVAQAAPPVAPPPTVTTTDPALYAELERSRHRYTTAEREINAVWRALPKAVRDANLQQQRQFNKDKESNCARQASEAGAGPKFEIAKNDCWADLYDKRTPELKALQ